jgi:FKBP-type peptidyl-prolyl cis-trans isomerase FkpA
MHHLTRFVTAALFLPALTLAGCAGGAAPVLRPRPTVETTPFSAALNVDLTRMTKTKDGAYYRDLEVGTGAVLRGSEEVKVRYTGWLSNGVQFDATKPDDPPLTIPLGGRNAIKGLVQGLTGMRVGGRRQLVVPPELGYGSERTGVIPGDAVLVFDIRVLSAK